jgi:hypothetical protein
MKIGDFIVWSYITEPTSAALKRVGEITSVDPVGQVFSCRRVDSDVETSFSYSDDPNVPWHNEDAFLDLETHDIYALAAMTPAAQDAAVVTFSDGRRYIGYVENVSPSTDVVFYHAPYYRLSLELDAITESDWDSYPAGSQIMSIERCVLDNEMPTDDNVGVFNQGWWSLANRRDAHPGRIGGPIDAFSIVVHTTDMVPEAWNALLTSWTTTMGHENCAHFAIGRDATTGIVQFAPITKNANHAEGDGHGMFVAGSQSWRPNHVSVGIEVHCVGGIRRVNGQWRYVERNVPYGDPIPAADVAPDPDNPHWGLYNHLKVKLTDDGEWYLVRDEPQGNPIPETDAIPDPAHPDRGWHQVTDYQYEQLDKLLRALDTVLDPLPANCVAHSIQPPPAFGIFPTGRIVGHVSLAAADRSDPWPPTCDWLRARS